MKQFLFAGLLGLVSPGFAQSVPAHAEGLQEELVSVTLADGKRTQPGVYSIKKGTAKHTRLAVLLPGYPCVLGCLNYSIQNQYRKNYCLATAQRTSSDGLAMPLSI